MDRFAASEALDCMEAYYKVALKRFTDDVAVELVEIELIQALSEIFSPVTVFSMQPELVERIAGESDETRSTRDELSKQLEVLGKGSDFCKRFVGMKLTDVIMEQARGNGMVVKGDVDGDNGEVEGRSPMKPTEPKPEPEPLYNEPVREVPAEVHFDITVDATLVQKMDKKSRRAKRRLGLKS